MDRLDSLEDMVWKDHLDSTTPTEKAKAVALVHIARELQLLNKKLDVTNDLLDVIVAGRHGGF